MSSISYFQNPSKSFDDIMRFVGFICSCVGCNVYVPNYRVNIVTAIVVVTIVVFTSFTIFTAIEKMDFMFGLQVCCMLGSGIQGMNKLYTGIVKARRLYELSENLSGIYVKYEKEPEPEGNELDDDGYLDILWRNLYRTKQALVLVALSYILGMCGMVGTPVIGNLLTGKRYMIMHFRIPGLDPNNQLVYIFTQTIQALFICIGAFGLYAGDISFIVFLMQSYNFSDILRLKVRSLNIYVEEQSEKKYKKATEMLIDIIKWQQYYQKFVSDCNYVFYTTVSVQILTAALCIVLTIFVNMSAKWLSAYPYLLFLIPNMYLYCILGTLVENCTDDMMYHIYNISFYNLSVPQQRMMLFMVAKSQTTDVIQVLGVLPLSVTTALAISRSIYSITMMMVQFLE